MTSPATTTGDVDATTAAAASPALVADPGRASTVATDAESTVNLTADTAGFDVAVSEAKESLPTVGVFYDADGREHYASPVSKATVAKLRAGEWSTEEPTPPFDPTKARVKDVVAYLKEHAHDADEIARVRAAEAAGENRPTIRDWPPAE